MISKGRYMKLYMKFLLLTFLSATVVHAERGLKVQNHLIVLRLKI